MSDFTVDPEDLIAVAGAFILDAADLGPTVRAYVRATTVPDAFGAPAVFGRFPEAYAAAITDSTTQARNLLETLDGLAKTLLAAAELYAAADAASSVRTP